MQNTEEKICEIIKGLLNNPNVELDGNVCLIEDLGFDSVQIMNLIVTLEDEFGFEFDDSNMLFDHFNKLSSLCDLVNQMLDRK